jgi:hypothetical protein
MQLAAIDRSMQRAAIDRSMQRAAIEPIDAAGGGRDV